MNPKRKVSLKWFLLLASVLALIVWAYRGLVSTRSSKTFFHFSPITSNARGIVLGLTLYSNDHDGYFPPKGRDANESLRQLFPSVFDESGEKMFHLIQDKVYCQPVPPDGNIEVEKALAPGENHWAYVAGLRDTAPEDTPILADGFTAPGHRYDKRHYAWKDKRAVVGYINGTAIIERLVVEGDTGYVPAPNGKGNLFAPENLPPGAVLLNPALPKP